MSREWQATDTARYIEAFDADTISCIYRVQAATRVLSMRVPTIKYEGKKKHLDLSERILLMAQTDKAC